jgi:hypothetical protein
MCLKMGGWVRAEYAYGDNGNMAWAQYAGNVNNKTTNNTTFRARGYITADARNQSEYGTIRSYIAVGLNTNDVGLNTAANQFSANRAFVQLAGFTFGISQSFFDFYSVPATALWGAYPASDTGDPGWLVAGYTAQFGNGVSATIAAEERRMTQNYNAQIAIAGPGVGSTTPGAFPTTSVGATANAGAYGGFNMPDIVANLRVDQSWGGAQIMGALHEVNSGYYSGTVAAGGAPLPSTGSPSDKYGFAVGAGLKLNAPMVGPGDYFQTQVNYTQGALRYLFSYPNVNFGIRRGNSAAWGVLTDAVYGGNMAPTNDTTSLQLTRAWGFNAAYEHFWNKQWRTSLYGGYDAVSYNGQSNAMLCAGMGAGTAPVGSLLGGANSVANAGCDQDWNTWFVGSRTQWNVTADTYFGLDVLYQRLESASSGATTVPVGVIPTTLTGAAIGQAGSMDNWSARFRVHKDFYP